MADTNPSGLTAILDSAVDDAADLELIWDASATELKKMTLAEKAKTIGNNLAAGGVSADVLADGSTNKAYTAAEKTKLAGIETAADVTDAANVAAAGAVMTSAIGSTVQAYDAELAALAGLTSAADKGIQFTGAGTAGTFDLTAAGKALLDDASASAQRTTLGLGTMATAAAADYLPLVAAGASVENVGAIESNVNTVATTGATETLDTSLYAVHDCTMDQNCTFTFSNPAPSGKNSTFMLILRGAYTPTLPASVDWADATPPTYTTPSVYVFTTVDAGTTWLGQQVGKAFG